MKVDCDLLIARYHATTSAVWEFDPDKGKRWRADPRKTGKPSPVIWATGYLLNYGAGTAHRQPRRDAHEAQDRRAFLWHD